MPPARVPELEEKVEALRQELAQRDGVIAELTAKNAELKAIMRIVRASLDQAERS